MRASKPSPRASGAAACSASSTWAVFPPATAEAICASSSAATFTCAVLIAGAGLDLPCFFFVCAGRAAIFSRQRSKISRSVRRMPS
ncbi:MAG: hypothetical protein WKG00_39520 [Polyangiaceae bacterium]